MSREIAGHEVKTVRQLGWTGIKNGELRALAAEAFDVFVTVDRNLSFQQNVASFPIAVMILEGKTNRLADLKHFIPELLSAITSARKSAIHRVGAP